MSQPVLSRPKDRFIITTAAQEQDRESSFNHELSRQQLAAEQLALDQARNIVTNRARSLENKLKSSLDRFILKKKRADLLGVTLEHFLEFGEPAKLQKQAKGAGETQPRRDSFSVVKARKR